MVSVTTVDEGAVCTAMLDLYQNEGIIAEPAGALSVAGLLETGLAEAGVQPGSTVVCLISGGNNDVSRYGEVIERSPRPSRAQTLLSGGLSAGARRCDAFSTSLRARRHHALRAVKRNNRETGEALVGIELGSAAGLDGLRDRMADSGLHVEALEPGRPRTDI